MCCDTGFHDFMTKAAATARCDDQVFGCLHHESAQAFLAAFAESFEELVDGKFEGICQFYQCRETQVFFSSLDSSRE